MAGPNGGARPGAGRKAKSTVVYQTKMRALVEKTVTGDVWQTVILKALEQAQKGDDRARQWLTPWVLGAPPKPAEDAEVKTPILVVDL